MINPNQTELLYEIAKELNHPVKRNIVNDFIKQGTPLPVSRFNGSDYGSSNYVNQILRSLRETGILIHVERKHRDSLLRLNEVLVLKVINFISKL